MDEPRCYECLTTDAAVKLIGPGGLEVYLCAADNEAALAFKAKIDAMLSGAVARLKESSC